MNFQNMRLSERNQSLRNTLPNSIYIKGSEWANLETENKISGFQKQGELRSETRSGNLGDDENVLDLGYGNSSTTQCTKKHWFVYFKQVSFMLYELSLLLLKEK